MANSRKLEVLITGNAKQAQKAMGDLSGAAGKSESSLKKSLGGISRHFGAVAVAATAWKAFDGWNESQKILQQTEAVIRSTGGAANVTAGEVNDLASAISLNTGIHDEAIQTGQNLLLTFVKIRNEVGEGNDIFDQATAIMTDMSVAMGTDTKQSAIQLGKALNDPVRGVTALTRVGIQFTDQQKAQIKALAESGDMLGAQKVILAELTTQFEGSAAAQATSMDKAKVSISNMSDEIMGVLAPAIETVTSGVAGVAQGFASLPQPVQNATVGLAAAAAVGPKLYELGSAAVDSGRKLADMAKNAIVPTKAIDGLGTSTVTTTGSLSKFTRGLGVAAAGAGAFTVTLEVLKEMSDFDGSIEDLTTDLDNFGKGATDVETAVGQTGRSVEELAGAFRLNAAKADSYFGGFKKFAREGGVAGALDTRKAASDLGAIDDALAGMVKSGNIDEAKAAYGRLSAAMIDAGIPAEDIASAMNDYWDQVDRSRESDAAATISGVGDASEDAAGATDDAASATKTYAEKLKDVESAASDATTAIEEFFGAQTDSTGSKIEAERALDDLSQSIRDNGLALSISGEKGRENRESIIAARDAALDYAMSIREQTGSSQAAADAMHTYAGSLRQTLLDGGFTEAQVESLITEMGLTPQDITTTFHENATAAEAKAKAFNDELDRITPRTTTDVVVNTDAALASIANVRNQLSTLGTSVAAGTAGRAMQESARHYASGGRPGKGEIHWVGEDGPELRVGDGASTIIPANLSARMMAGSSPGRPVSNAGGGGGATLNVVVNVAGNVTSERDLMESLRSEFDRQLRLYGGSGLFQNPGLRQR